MRTAWILTALFLAWVPGAAVAQTGNEAPRALTDRGLENLVAFTRLLGYVRFFHPSDQAAAADWDRFAMVGVERVEGAENPQDLARALQDLFAPLAPTVEVFPTPPATTAPKPAVLPAPAGSSPRYLAWSHTGVGLKKDHYLYSSRRVADLSELDHAGTLAREVDATALRGKRVRFRASLSAEVAGDDVARLYLASVADKYQTRTSPEAEKTAVREAQWREAEATLEVPEDALQVRAGVILPTGGRAWIDDVTLEVVGDGRNLLDDPGFEQAGGGKVPAGWATFEYGYAAAVSEERPHGGKRSLVLSYTPMPRPPLPRAGEVFAAELGGGVSARVPLSVPVDGERRTLPTPPIVAPGAPARPEGFTPNAGDRATRLAAVVQAWNVFQHFYPYFDVVPADWPESLRQALRSAAAEGSEAAFQATLERLLAGLHDGHGWVIPPTPPAVYQFPLVWEWIEDRLVVTHVPLVHAAAVPRGSVVLSVDGRPAADVLRDLEARTPAASPHYRRWKAVQTLGRGAQDEKVRLELLRPDGTTATVELARSSRPADLRERRPAPLEELSPGIFYVDLGRRSQKDLTGQDLDQLAAARGIVFDLRGGLRVDDSWLGHLADAPFARPLMQLPFFHRPDRQDLSFEPGFWELQPLAPRLRGKVAFLTDARAISSMESFLGSVEHHKLGEIVGGPTAGTNGDVNPLTVPGGYTLYWTGLRVLKQDGSRHHGVGIRPTVPVSRTRQGVIEGKDEILERALEIVSR